MNTFSKLVPALLFCLAILTPVAHGEDMNLCEAGVEGTYSGKFGDAPLLLNLFCLDGMRVLASMSDQPYGVNKVNTSTVVNLPIVEVDGDSVILSVASLRAEDRKSLSSKSQYTYLKLKLAELRNGAAVGYYYNGNVRDFLPVSARRVQTFPRLAAAKQQIDANAITGAYSFTAPTFGGRGVLLADVVFGAPLISLQMSDTESIHLIDSTAWNGTGLISSATAVGDAEPDGRKLFFFRGVAVTEREIDFYLVTPVAGLLGPFRALR